MVVLFIVTFRDEADCIKKVIDRLMSVLHIESDDDDVRAFIRGMDIKSPILIDGGKMGWLKPVGGLRPKSN
ncbi:hypothetical protein MTR67_050181 [Solanum verrucosum]|uniref:Uncharacterized protein n=1 Tax=Solanum verrucosum TaxID=315347 RepID=A0AAF0V4S2_SOLVR|nr:hypothetical protein MTR67_050181 [Solanum verrucosum]